MFDTIDTCVSKFNVLNLGANGGIEWNRNRGSEIGLEIGL